MNKSRRDYVMTAIGLVLLGVGLVLVKAASELQALPYICIGVGSGIFGHGMGSIMSRKAMKNSPDLQKQLEIDQKDERNVEITNRAKAKAYDRMLYIFGALMITFALMGVDVIVVLLLVFAYLLVGGHSVYYQYKYNKEM